MNKELIIFSMFKWSSELMHREHMIAKSFQKLGFKVTFVERRYLKPHEIVKSKTSARVDDNIKIVTVPSFPYMKGKIKPIYQANDKILARSLKKILSDSDKNAWLLITMPNWAKAVISTKRKSQVLAYDISDDMSAFAANNKWKKIVQNYEENLTENADLVLLTTKELLSKVKNNKNVFIVENGVDLDDFKDAKPILKKEFKRPIAGYIGGIFDWVDLKIIKKAADLNPEIDFVLVGPTNKRKEIDVLQKIANIYYLGEIPWPQIPDYFASLDVGLMPFVSEKEYPRLKTANSNKLYQYAYFGYPIVSTPFNQVKNLGDIVKISSPENFAKSVRETILESDKKTGEKRISFAKEHSWKQQAEKILHAFKSKTN